MKRPPNILWIVTTQWRGQALGCLGDPNVQTPELDRFAEEACIYPQAITPHPFGPFARAALLTGIPCPSNGVQDYYDPLPSHSRTIAHSLTTLGYSTAFIGKWHLSPKDRNAPLVGEIHARQNVPKEFQGGFEHWEGFEGGFQLNQPWLQGGEFSAPTQYQGYQSEVLVDRALNWLHQKGQSSQRPWFLLLSLEAPHPPYASPAGEVVAPDPQSLHLNPNVPGIPEVESKARTELAGYLAHIQATDKALGRLLRSPLLDQAATVFTSVHGDMHGAHGLFRKGWPHEESIRIPLLVKHPRRPRFNTDCNISTELPSLLDLHRWTINWAQGQPAAACRPLQTLSMPSVVKIPLQCDRSWTGYRTDSEKLIFNPDGTPWLLFDLARDPWERCNLLQASGKAQLKALMPRLRARLPRFALSALEA